MTEQRQRHPLEVPSRGEPSDWHWFLRKRGGPAAPGDVALCGYVLADIGQIDSLNRSGAGSGRAQWCPLCDSLVEFVRDGLTTDLR